MISGAAIGVGAGAVVAGSGLGTGGGVAPVDPGPFPAFAPAFYRFSADDAANTTVQVDQTFAPSAVNTATGLITLPGIGMPAFAGYNSCQANVVYFSSTGTLPAPLVAGTPYYITGTAGAGYQVYPVASGADWSNLSTAMVGETLLPAQNFAQGANAIVFTTQGTGTHRVQSDVLIDVLADQGGGVFTTTARTPDNHSRLPTKLDAQGHRYIESRLLARNHNETTSSNSIYGRSPTQGPGAQKLAARQAVAAKRTILQMYVVAYRPTKPRQLAKASFVPANVNTTTGVLTFNKRGTAAASAHSLSTALRVRLFVDVGGVLPTGLAGGAQDYWVRSASSTTITLHPSLADANANTNVVIPTTQGGGFTVYATERAALSDRQRFLTEMLDPASGANVLSAGWEKITGEGGDSLVSPVSDFQSTGLVGAAGRVIFSTVTPVMRSYFRWPGASVAPTRTDTGLPMAEGWYWVIRSQSSSANAQVFDDNNYAGALAAQQGSLAPAASQCIKFNAGTGSGFADIFKSRRPFSIGALSPSTEVLPATLPPSNQKMVLTLRVDYNDPSASFAKHSIFLNETKIAEYETDGAKGLTGAAVNDGSPAWTLLNSAASHVTFEGDLYAGLFGSSTGAIADGDLAPVISWYKTKYGIA